MHRSECICVSREGSDGDDEERQLHRVMDVVVKQQNTKQRVVLDLSSSIS